MKIQESLALILGTLLVFIQPVVGLFILTLFFMLIDTFYAVYAVIKLEGWSKVTSRRGGDIIVKGVIYGSGVMVSHMIDVFILKDSLFFGIPPIAARATTVIIILIEGKSIDETRMKLGKKSFFVMLREWINKGKRFKQDVNELM
jgi:phage-related holin